MFAPIYIRGHDVLVQLYRQHCHRNPAGLGVGIALQLSASSLSSKSNRVSRTLSEDRLRKRPKPYMVSVCYLGLQRYSSNFDSLNRAL